MLPTHGYAALTANAVLQPFSFERREVGNHDVLITRVTYDQNDTPCEFSRDLFRGDRTRLAVTAQGRGVGKQPSVAAASVALQSQPE